MTHPCRQLVTRGDGPTIVFPVQRTASLVVGFIVAGFAVALAVCAIPTQNDRVRGLVEELADAASFESGPSQRSDTSRLETLITTGLADPIVLDVAELGAKNRSVGELHSDYLAYARQLRRLRFRLSHLDVEMEPRQTRAIAKADLTVEAELTGGERRAEPRKLVCTLEQRRGKWHVIHAKVTAPRIDQPEARP